MHGHHHCSFLVYATCYRVTSWHHTKDHASDCPFKHEGTALVVPPGCSHHLQSVWVGVLCILNAFCRGKLPPSEECLTHSASFIFPHKNMRIPNKPFYPNKVYNLNLNTSLQCDSHQSCLFSCSLPNHYQWNLLSFFFGTSQPNDNMFLYWIGKDRNLLIPVLLAVPDIG